MVGAETASIPHWLNRTESDLAGWPRVFAGLSHMRSGNLSASSPASISSGRPSNPRRWDGYKLAPRGRRILGRPVKGDDNREGICNRPGSSEAGDRRGHCQAIRRLLK